MNLPDPLPYFLACLIGGVAVPTIFFAGSGCSALVAAVPMVSELVSDGEIILDMIDSGIRAYQAAHPSVMTQDIAAQLQATRASLVAGGQSLAGRAGVTQDQEATAFANFVRDYTSLMQLVAPLGIVSEAPVVDGGARAEAPGQLVVKLPLILRSKTQVSK